MTNLGESQGHDLTSISLAHFPSSGLCGFRSCEPEGLELKDGVHLRSGCLWWPQHQSGGCIWLKEAVLGTQHCVILLGKCSQAAGWSEGRPGGKRHTKPGLQRCCLASWELLVAELIFYIRRVNTHLFTPPHSQLHVSVFVSPAILHMCAQSVSVRTHARTHAHTPVHCQRASSGGTLGSEGGHWLPCESSRNQCFNSVQVDGLAVRSSDVDQTMRFMQG